MKMINIPIKERNLCQVYVEFLNPILKLTKTETEVISELMYWYFEYKYLIDDKIRFKMVFDYDTKAKIIDYLGISHQTLLNVMTSLRKKGWLYKATLSKKFLSLVNDYENKSIIIKFTTI